MTDFDPDFYTIGPGFLGFLATFVMALAVIVIYRSLNKHLRKIRRQEERVQEELRAKRAGLENRSAPEKRSGPENGEGDSDVMTSEPGDGQ